VRALKFKAKKQKTAYAAFVIMLVKLDGSLDFTATEAPGADHDPAGRTVNVGLDPLQIGRPFFLGAYVRVTDFHAYGNTFTAY